MKVCNQPVKRIHISLTHICNSYCKLCDRFKSDEKVGSQLSKKQIDNLFTPKLLEDLIHVSICGNTGEPTLGKNFLYLLQKIADLKPSVTIRVNTNGDTHPEKWWHDLASKYIGCFNDYFKVTFCIDGLTNQTHQKYRTTDVNNVFNNMLAFKNAGGLTEWQYLIFEHNQHEVNEARSMAADWGIEFLLAKSRKYNINGNLNEDYKLSTDELQEPIFPDDAFRCGSGGWRDTPLEERKINPVCLWYKGEFFVRPDGEIRTCCYRNYKPSYNYEDLNLSDFPIEEILTAKDFKIAVNTIGVAPNCIKHCNERIDNSACQKIGEMLLSNIKDENIINKLLNINEKILTESNSKIECLTTRILSD